MAKRWVSLFVCFALVAGCKSDAPTKNNDGNGTNNGSNNGANNGANNGDPNNDPPVANDDMETVSTNSSLLVDVLANDSDPDGDALIIVDADQPQNGATEIEGDRIRYTPNPNFGGVDSFRYTIADPSGATSTARVRLVVESGPIALDDDATAQPGETLVIQVLLNDSHPLGGTLTVSNVDDPLGGTATTDGNSVTYVSDPQTSGLDVFDYTIIDETGATARAEIRVDVNSRPTTAPDEAQTPAETRVVIDVLANDSDPDDDTLSIGSVTAPPSGGSAVIEGTRVAYTPPAGFGGIDSFTYTAADGHGNETPGLVTVSVNSVPVAVDDAIRVFVDQVRTIDVLANDTDSDGDPLSVTGVTQPSPGSATTDGTTVTFTPGAGFEGVLMFDYTISDGRGASDTATITVEVAPPFRGLRFTAGEEHTCRVRADDTLLCWGSGQSGQLGTGAGLSSPTPTQVGSATDWQSVSGGSRHTCGVRQNGTLWCWGSNSDQVFGTDTISSTNTPLQIGTDNDWRFVATHDRHSCALKETGELYCGGWNLDGEVGVGSSSLWIDNYRQVGAFDDWSVVTAGSGHTCGIRGIGQLWCWGENSSGQLGHATARDSDIPLEIGPYDDWDFVSAGYSYTCGLRNGELYCWGSGYRGQLGTGGTSQVPTPTQIGSASDWTAIATRFWHTCGVRGGQLFCWGDNTYGQLGDGSILQRANPTRIGTDTDWADVGVGRYHTCAVKTDGRSFCWGRDTNGALGDGQLPGSLVPVNVTPGQTYIDVVTSSVSTCAVRSNGSLWCWGFNDDGALGNGATDPQQSPTQAGFSTDWAWLQRGPDFFCGIKNNDSMWCWGNNWLGMLGDGSRNDRPNPTLIGGGATWTSMDGGSQHSCGTRTNGTMWCWGQNSRRQLADGALNESLFPLQIGTDTDWDQASVGAYMSCGLKSGQIWCWGENYSDVPTQIGTDTSWREISVADDQICALKTDDTLWCWSARSAPQTPTLIVSDTDWDMLAAEADDHVCALKNSGSLWCWGANGQGQLGDGTTISKTSPNPIGSATWLDVATGGGSSRGHTCGIQTDGSLWCWGSDTYGQLGLDGAWVTTPQPVANP